MDGQAGPVIEQSMNDLCDDETLVGLVCQPKYRSIAFEKTNTKRGWYYHHYHHFHVSILSKNRPPKPLSERYEMPSIVPKE